MMAVLLLESEIKCLLAPKFLQMNFSVSKIETIGFVVKAVKFGVCANTLIISSLSTPFTQKKSVFLMPFNLIGIFICVIV